MNNIKLVVSDIDGTLITSEGKVSPAVRREIQRVTDQGIHFAIASGRPTKGVKEVSESWTAYAYHRLERCGGGGRGDR
ncbi:MAG: HAD hydrolase family protein [Chloroflexia bacterium]